MSPYQLYTVHIELWSVANHRVKKLHVHAV